MLSSSIRVCTSERAVSLSLRYSFLVFLRAETGGNERIVCIPLSIQLALFATIHSIYDNGVRRGALTTIVASLVIESAIVFRLERISLKHVFVNV